MSATFASDTTYTVPNVFEGHGRVAIHVAKRNEKSIVIDSFGLKGRYKIRKSETLGEYVSLGRYDPLLWACDISGKDL